jgi:hypothetical protein
VWAFSSRSWEERGAAMNPIYRFEKSYTAIVNKNNET